MSDHDKTLARLASIAAGQRIDAGEPASVVIPEVLGLTRHRYAGAPWCIWDAQERQFITAAMAGEFVSRALEATRKRK
jgi:hypothetical protein